VKHRVYVYSGCDTCRKALKFLDEHRVAYETVPIREQPPTKKELKSMLVALGGELRRLFNTSGQDYKALNLKDKLPVISTEEAIELLAGCGNLVKRPFLLTSKGCVTGFKPDEWKTLLGLR
jgi:arsenate reductase (glutaredoxin)